VNKVQRGFSLVSAIFLLVVLAALGAAMVTFSTTQNQSMVMDVMGSRAYQAANAGIEWAAYNIEFSPGVSSPAATIFSPTGTALAGDLAPFTVVVGYSALAQSDAAIAGSGVVAVWSYRIAASAAYSTAGAPDYVERVLNAKM
jgi:MSHA biogenesis protein MshP